VCFFVYSVLISLFGISSHNSQVPVSWQGLKEHSLSIAGEDQVQDHLRNLDIHKSMGPDEIPQS